MALRSYQELEVWRRGMDLAVDCYSLTRMFPREELFGLTSQIRRAAASIPANIAEGQGRQSTKNFLNFLGIALGSLKELETHLILSHRVGLLEEEDLSPMLRQTTEIGRMLSGLKRSLENRL